MEISVCLEVGLQATGAFVPDCPGCWTFGRTRKRAMEKVKTCIIEWFEWLRNHGERVPEIGFKPKIRVAEMITVDYDPAEAGKPEPLFWSEVLPVEKEEIERTIRLMDYSRNDLLSLVSKLTQERLDWRPLGEPRTIRNCLEHIAWVEPWYISRLNIELPKDYPKDVFKLLDYTRHIVNECLRNFPQVK